MASSPPPPAGGTGKPPRCKASGRHTQFLEWCASVSLLDWNKVPVQH